MTQDQGGVDISRQGESAGRDAFSRGKIVAFEDFLKNQQRLHVSISSGARILDLNGGEGPFSQMLKHNGYVRSLTAKGGEQFNAVIAMGVLGNMKDDTERKAKLAEMGQSLMPGGIALVDQFPGAESLLPIDTEDGHELDFPVGPEASRVVNGIVLQKHKK
ncbi:hypothetical protein HY969_01970 [Candidatus Kaiserbacteria bacterium]|nr:hypothetical protein [Candidatus Kaiserbacteria bacterium]